MFLTKIVKLSLVIEKISFVVIYNESLLRPNIVSGPTSQTKMLRHPKAAERYSSRDDSRVHIHVANWDKSSKFF